ncbi:MAG: adenosylmethionine--8-amino-7-oxononanoate transaminase [Planctomycetota bacterium]
MTNQDASLAKRDQELIWHPFTQMKTSGMHVPLVRAAGALLYDEDGNEFIDAIGSWWVNLHGHAHPHLAASIASQAQTLPHVMFAGFTHEPAIQLCERLQRWLPNQLKRFFFSDNGSTATEIALKMAIQFRVHQDGPRTEPLKVIALEGSYHGDTFGAMSVGERDVFVKPFLPYLFDVITIPAPTPGNESKSQRALERAIEKHDVAAFIFEPLIQAAFGMQMHEPEALDRLLGRCRDAGVLTIADEVMTGFFKTGTCFASHQLKTPVDFICLSKALTSGTLPLALTVTTERVFNAFYDDDKSKAFFHGHSYTGNPLGCVAAIASLDLIESGGFKPNLRRITEFLEAQAQSYRKQNRGENARFSSIRQKGIVLALELNVPDKVGYLSDFGPRFFRAALKHGVLLRPLGEVIYVVPPICISNDQLERVFQVIDHLLDSSSV